MNLPKFVQEDVPLFLGLIKDLFPGLEYSKIKQSDFNEAVKHALTEKKYVLIGDQVSINQRTLLSPGLELKIPQ